jgi:hypothetical protein
MKSLRAMKEAWTFPPRSGAAAIVMTVALVAARARGDTPAASSSMAPAAGAKPPAPGKGDKTHDDKTPSPAVTSVTPTSGQATADLVLVGSDFGAVGKPVKVFFGADGYGKECDGKVVSDKAVTCRASVDPAQIGQALRFVVVSPDSKASEPSKATYTALHAAQADSCEASAEAGAKVEQLHVRGANFMATPATPATPPVVKITWAAGLAEDCRDVMVLGLDDLVCYATRRDALPSVTVGAAGGASNAVACTRSAVAPASAPAAVQPVKSNRR